ELARIAADPAALQRHLDHLNTDVTELNAFVTATLEYAVLERAEMSLNIVAQQRYRLCVEDDGPGIAEADRERVFDSFVQLGRPTGEKAGFGLGLAIVKRILEWHGGSAHVEQSALNGARFVVDWRAR